MGGLGKGQGEGGLHASDLQEKPLARKNHLPEVKVFASGAGIKTELLKTTFQIERFLHLPKC